MTTRKLTRDEITSLQSQHCSAEDWNTIEVNDNFTTDTIKNVEFCGNITLGKFNKELKLDNGTKIKSGLKNCRISNCSISDDVYINGVNLISNYSIEKEVIVDNVNSIVVDGETAFGNGIELDVVNEGGGRTMKIFDKLSSNFAYLMVFYRHNKKFIEALDAMVDEYVNENKSTKGIIKTKAKITNSGSIKNVIVGEYATINETTQLKEGTIVSCKEDPTFIGCGVVAENFIIQSGSKITEGALITNSFIGQACKIGKQYSAENSMFFANSEAFHGEGCSVFGGPYTVTHHKSSLLIAGLFSFYNAGSGTNQSNHMYKLGPIHQGIVERGSKTGSFCYLLWPCRVGAFSTVLGKHYANFNTENLPFSYINEEEGKSFITPAMNMFTVGTRRDSLKWPARDKRKAVQKRDLINFDLFSPYTVGKMLKGIEELSELYENTPKEKELVKYHGINLRRLLLKTSRKYYEMGVSIFIGETLNKRFANLDELSGWGEIKTELNADTINGLQKWVDIGGLLASESLVNEFVFGVVNNRINSLNEAYSSLDNIHKQYRQEEWNWCAALIEQKYDCRLEKITPEILKNIIADWKKNKIRLNNMIVQDAMKEFDSFAKIGFGIDGDDSVQQADFEACRGTAEDNSFINGVMNEIKEIEKTAEKLTGIVENSVSELSMAGHMHLD